MSFRLICCVIAIMCSSSLLAGPLIKCQNEKGRTVYSDNEKGCHGVVDRLDMPRPGGQVKDKYGVSYRHPERGYILEDGILDIYVEQGMRDADPQLYRTAVEKLRTTLDYVFSIAPARATSRLRTLKVYLLWGAASPLGGRKSGMSYIRSGEPDNWLYLDPRWENALVVYSAENLVYLNDLWSRKAVFHELAHAWHILNWPEQYAPIHDAWAEAMASGKYTNVTDVKGKTIESAYARKNQLEYFAELSAMYFVGGNYMPYDRDGLRKYDPTGYQMIEQLWY